MNVRVGNFLRNERGIAALEYALIAGLIFAAIIVCGRLFGPQLSSAFSNLGTSVDARALGT